MWSDDFYIGVRDNGECGLVGRLLAANLPGPQDFTLTIDADVSVTEMSLDELLRLPDPLEDD